MNNQKIQVLFIDDEPHVRSAVQGAAANKNIILRVFSNLDDGMNELRANNNIKFIILDAKGFINQGQVRGTESDSFALAAHIKIDELAKEQNRYLPYCFYTGHSDLNATWKGAGGFTVFDKTEDDVLEKLFEHIWDKFNNSEEGILRFRYPQLFNAIDYIADTNIIIDLKFLLLGLERIDFGEIHSERTAICNTVRRIQEAVYKSLNRKNNQVIKDNHFQTNGMIKFNEVKKHLSGNQNNYIATTTEYQTQLIENISQTIYWGCGRYLHFNPNESYFPSSFGIKALIYGVFEQLKWFKELYSRI